MKPLTLKHFFTLPLVSTCLGLVIMACGPADTKNNPPPDEGYTLENVCVKTAPLNCDVREVCCAKAPSMYNEAGCMTDFTSECDKNVADVKAGIMTFDSESIDTCFAAMQPFAEKCFLEISDLLKLPTDLLSCTKIFMGQLKEGDACDRTAQCASSISDKEIVQCDDTDKKCVTTRFLPSGAMCNPLSRNFCDQGLYCDFDILTQKGTCKTATAVGMPCTPGTLSFECGIGYTCDAMAKVCTEANDVGEPCTTALDCKSAGCAGGVCEQAEPMFNKMQCTGMP
jgi:hypothetical protein